jgi:hypothetical protein
MDTKLIIPNDIIHKVIILKVGDTYRFKRKKQNEWLPNMVIYHKIIIPTNMNARFKNVVRRVIKDLRIERYKNAEKAGQDINTDGVRIRRFKKKIKKIEPPPVEPPPVEPPPVEPPPVEPPPVVRVGDRMKLRQMQRDAIKRAKEEAEAIKRAKEEEEKEEEEDEFCTVQ